MTRFKHVEITDVYLELEAVVKSGEQMEFFICLLSQADEKIG